MTANDESLQGTVVSDGTTGTVDSVTVPDGEVWFIDSLNVMSDGTGGSDGTTLSIRVGDASVLDTIEGEFVEKGRNKNAGPADNDASAKSVAVEAYAASGEEIRAGKVFDGNTGATFSYSITIRRIA